MRWFLCLVVLFALSSPSLAEEKPSGYDTPEAAFQGYLTGVVNRDWEQMLASCTPKIRATTIAQMVFVMGWVFDEDEMETLLAEHGLHAGHVDTILERPERMPIVLEQHAELEGVEFKDDTEEFIVRIMLSIKDAPGLMEKIWKRLKEVEQAQREGEAKEAPPEEENPLRDRPRRPVEEMLAELKFVDMQVEGDVATCRVERQNLAENEEQRGQASRYRFRRIDGRWYCDGEQKPDEQANKELPFRLNLRGWTYNAK